MFQLTYDNTHCYYYITAINFLLLLLLFNAKLLRAEEETPPGNMTDFNRCKVTQMGLDYMGQVAKTEGKVLCQSWTANTPIHKVHESYTDDKFPDQSKAKARNYCRNPSKSIDGPWCYTMDAQLSDDTCDIPLCSLSVCKLTGPGMEYGGKHNKAHTDMKCLKWNKNRKKVRINDTLIRIDKFKKKRFPENDLSEAKTYCRNPDGDVAGPWCFIEVEHTSEVRKSYCDIPFCDDQDCLVFTRNYSTYTHYTSFPKKLDEFNFGVKIWDPDSYLEASARLVLSLLPLPVTAQETHDLGTGIEIYLSNKKSALTQGNIDKPEFESTKGILKSTSYTFLKLMWDRNFITLNYINATKPIFLQEIRTKHTLMSLHKNQFHFYAAQGTNILWSFPFCDDDGECDVHTTSSSKFQQFWPLRETEAGPDLVFHVRASHSAYILLVPSPVLDFPNIKIMLAKTDNYTRITCTEYAKGPTITLKESIFPKLLSYWRWTTFSVTIFADTLQFHWTKDIGVFLIMEVKYDLVRSLKWFSPASENTLARWTFFCAPPHFARVRQAFLPECALTPKEASYVGTQSVTSEGMPCLPWSGKKLIPEAVHERFKDHPDDLLKMHNYCRDLNEAHEGTYCYAVSEFGEKRVDKHFCHIRKCKSAECRMAGTGNDYIGKVNTTRSNRTCQFWIADIPVGIVRKIYDQRKKWNPDEDVEEDLKIPTILANETIMKTTESSSTEDIAALEAFSKQQHTPWKEATTPSDAQKAQAEHSKMLKFTQATTTHSTKYPKKTSDFKPEHHILKEIDANNIMGANLHKTSHYQTFANTDICEPCDDKKNKIANTSPSQPFGKTGILVCEPCDDMKNKTSTPHAETSTTEPGTTIAATYNKLKVIETNIPNHHKEHIVNNKQKAEKSNQETEIKSKLTYVPKFTHAARTTKHKQIQNQHTTRINSITKQEPHTTKYKNYFREHTTKRNNYFRQHKTDKTTTEITLKCNEVETHTTHTTKPNHKKTTTQNLEQTVYHKRHNYFRLHKATTTTKHTHSFKEEHHKFHSEHDNAKEYTHSGKKGEDEVNKKLTLKRKRELENQSKSMDELTTSEYMTKRKKKADNNVTLGNGSVLEDKIATSTKEANENIITNFHVVEGLNAQILKKSVEDIEKLSKLIARKVPAVSNISDSIKDYFNKVEDKNIKHVKVHTVDINLLNGTLYADMTPERAENFCRNPSRSIAGSWCYTMDQFVIQEPCNVPDCDREEVCTVFVLGLGTGRDVFILPQWKEEGIHGGMFFSIKQWNPDLTDGVIIDIRSFHKSPRLRLIIGDDDNDKIVLYKDNVLLEKKTLPHIIPAGKWVSLWLQIRQGELRLGYEGISDALFEWKSENAVIELNPIFLNFQSNYGNPMGLFFKCDECHAENTTTPHFTKIQPINIWTANEKVTFHNLTLQVRAWNSFKVNLFNLPGSNDYYIIYVHDFGRKMALVKSLRRLQSTLITVSTENPIITENSWTVLNISFTEQSIKVTSNSTSILTYNSSVPLLFYYFALTAGEDSWVTWMANCEPLDIDGPPKHGGWSQWGPFVCTVSCGGGEGYRTRTCSNPRPNIFGHLCHGPHSSIGPCNEFECGDLSPATFEQIRTHLQKTNFSIVLDAGKSVRIYNDPDILYKIALESPDAYYDWTANGLFLEPQPGRIDFIGDDVVIKNVTEADSGVYICMLYRINKQRLVIHAISIAVKPKNVTITTRATLPITLLCKSLSLAYVYSDLTQKWFLNDTLFLDYGITTLAAVSSETIKKTNMSLTGIWKCVVEQDDLRLIWVTNIVKVVVKKAPNFYTHLMEDSTTKPIFGKLKSEGAVLAVIILIVVVVFGGAAFGLFAYLKWCRLPPQYQRGHRKKKIKYKPLIEENEEEPNTDQELEPREQTVIEQSKDDTQPISKRITFE